MSVIEIYNWDTFLDWKEKNNNLASAVGDTAKITVGLNSTIVGELLKLKGQGYSEDDIKDFIGRWLASSSAASTGVDITYNATTNQLTFEVTAEGNGLGGYTGLTNTADGVESLFEFWQSIQPAGADTSITAFFSSLVGNTGGGGTHGIRGVDSDGNIFRMSLEVYRRTAADISSAELQALQIPDTENGSSIDVLSTNVNATFIAPAGWTAYTPPPDENDPASTEALWRSSTIVTSLPIFNSSRVYNLGDRVIWNSQTYEFIWEDSVDKDLVVNWDPATNAVSLSYHYIDIDSVTGEISPTDNRTVAWDPAVGYYKDEVYGSVITRNGYNFSQQLGLDSAGNLNTSTGTTQPGGWTLVLDASGNPVGTKIMDIPNWSSPQANAMAGDGSDGRSGTERNVYTLDPSNTWGDAGELIAPIGGSFNFMGDGELTVPVAPLTDPDVHEWVAKPGDAMLPGGTETYAQNRTQGVLWYAKASFLSDTPTGSSYHTVDGLEGSEGKSWGDVLRSGTDGENANNTRDIQLFKRLTLNELNVEPHPVIGNTVKPTRWNFGTDQLEFDNLVGGGSGNWYRWPESQEDLVRLEAPAEMIASTFYPEFVNETGYGFVDTDRVGNVPPNVDYDTATQDDKLVTLARITAGGAFANIEEKYIGYYLGSPKPVIDIINGWWSRLASSTDLLTADHNLYAITAMASNLVGSVPNVDTTLTWRYENIEKCIVNINGYNGVDGNDGSDIKTVKLWARGNIGTLPSNSVTDNWNTYYNFSTNELLDLPTSSEASIASGWYLSNLNNINGFGCNGVDNCWTAADVHFMAEGSAIKPNYWVPWQAYNVDDYVKYAISVDGTGAPNLRTYKCIVATVFDRDTRANLLTESPESSSAHSSQHWDEVTDAAGASGVYSLIIDDWKIEATEVGNQGPEGEAGSKNYSGPGEPVIADTGTQWANGTHRFKFTLPSNVAELIVRINDQYVNTTTGELYEIQVDPANPDLVVPVLLWQMDITRKETDFIYRTWPLQGIPGTELGDLNSTNALAAANAELLQARKDNKSKPSTDPFSSVMPQLIPSHAADTENNPFSGWHTSMPAYNPDEYIICSASIALFRGNALPGDPSPVWDVVTDTMDTTAVDAFDPTKAYLVGKVVKDASNTAYISIDNIPAGSTLQSGDQWWAFGRNYLEYSVSWDSAAQRLATARWFYGDADPQTDFPHGICADGLDANNRSQPVACISAATSANRLDTVEGAVYVRTLVGSESAYKLTIDENNVKTWTNIISEMRGPEGTSGDQLVILYTTEQYYRDELDDAQILNLLPDPTVLNVNTISGWSKLEGALTDGQVRYKTTGFLEAGGTSWEYRTPIIDTPSIWHTPGPLAPHSRTFSPAAVDGDFYVQTSSDGTRGEKIWSYYRFPNQSIDWHEIVEEMTPSHWLDGPNDPNNSQGLNGDFFLNTTTEEVWKKTNNVWSASTNLKGAKGVDPERNAWVFIKVDDGVTPSSPPLGQPYTSDPGGGWYNDLADISGSVLPTERIWTSLGTTPLDGVSPWPVTHWSPPSKLTGDIGPDGPAGPGSIMLHTVAVNKPNGLPNGLTDQIIATDLANGGSWYSNGTTWTDAPADPTGDEVLWSTFGQRPEGIGSYYVFRVIVQASGSQGNPGIATNGENGARTASGTLYLSNLWTNDYTDPQPPYLSESNYNWSTNQWTTLSGTGWSVNPQTVTPEAVGKYFACVYTVVEGMNGNTGTVTTGSTIRSYNFNGTVSFSDLSDDTIGTTIIHGSNITTGTITATELSADAISTGMLNSIDIGSGMSFSLGDPANFGAGIAPAAASLETSVGDKMALIAIGTNTGASFTAGFGAIGDSSALGAIVQHTSYAAELPDRKCTFVGTNGGITWETEIDGAMVQGGGESYGSVSYISNLDNTSMWGGATTGWIAGDNQCITYLALHVPSTGEIYGIHSAGDAFIAGGAYIAGGVSPFTGCHKGLLDKSYSPVEGDILVDNGVTIKGDISNTITELSSSSSSNQKGVVGVFTKRAALTTKLFPAMLGGDVSYIEGDGVTPDSKVQDIAPEYTHYIDTHDSISMNSLGEGQVNVCGESGNLEIGDLIVTSSIAGKGKKQDDDIIRSYTVAKVREAVTFSDPTEVKLVACIYLCG